MCIASPGASRGLEMSLLIPVAFILQQPHQIEKGEVLAVRAAEWTANSRLLLTVFPANEDSAN